MEIYAIWLDNERVHLTLKRIASIKVIVLDRVEYGMDYPYRHSRSSANLYVHTRL